ncbi:hypothetical protein GM3709_3777 (plasmid) [Geminocystis sp. NIES-3709]|nr:hypothetical protein GM3709_3777 [Geminocystis sp. NIES-3709]
MNLVTILNLVKVQNLIVTLTVFLLNYDVGMVGCPIILSYIDLLWVNTVSRNLS